MDSGESILSKSVTWSTLAGSISAVIAVVGTMLWFQHEIQRTNERSLERLEIAVKDSDVVRRELDRSREETSTLKVEVARVSERLSVLQEVIAAQNAKIDALEQQIEKFEAHIHE